MSLDAEFTTKKPEKPKQKEKQTNKTKIKKQMRIFLIGKYNFY